MCRKQHGSLFGTSLGVAQAAFRWLAGEDAIVHYRATAAFERPFCRHCGSTVPAVSHDERYWHVPAGLLDGDVGARPRTHIFTASRSPLVELDDTLTRHDGYPAGIALPAIELQREHDASAAVAGSCLCGGVSFAATAMPRRLVNCHCSLCRRSRAAAFSSTLLVPRDAFRWSRGEARVRSYTLPATAMDGGSTANAGEGMDARGRATQGAVAGGNLRRPRNYGTDFCEDCGSLVPSAAPGSASAMLPAGAIDTALPPLPAVHLYVASKAPWHDIVDRWPQFQELPPPERFTEFFQ